MPVNRAAIWIANVALGVLCCWLVAGVLADVAGEALAPPALSAEGAAAPAGAPARTWQSRQVILERNLFKVSTAAPDTAIEDALAATKLPIKLLGTVAAGDPRRSWAAVEDLESRQHLVVRVGDRLQGKAELVRIERRRIVLRNGGRLEELALEDADGTATAGAGAARGPTQGAANAGRTAARSFGRPDPQRAASSGAQARPATDAAAARVQRLADNRYSVNRDEAQNNLATLMQEGRPLPKYENGKLVGWQIASMKQGGFWDQLGIRSDDTITEVNGVQIQSQEESAAVFRELTQAGEFNVTVTGADGEVRRLTYELR